MEFVASINQAITYMENNLLEDISTNDVAAHIYLSSFHFQRIFTLLTGMTVGEYMRNRRLSMAGGEFTKQDAKVIDVALKYGYDTPESFTKAFTRFHGITPSKAKKEGAVLKSFAPIIIKIKLEGGKFMDYRIESKEAFDVIGMTRVFNMESSAAEIPKYWSEFYSKGYGKTVCGVFGICHQQNDDEKKSGNFRYSIADPLKPNIHIPAEFETFTIPALTWAMFKCVGAMPNSIQDMWKLVYSEWLPNSEYELIPAYDIEMYTEGDTDSADYVSEIWIPVKKKSA